ncbi:3-isopropylmalate dehydratase small subunit [Sphaerisporangium rubeum]|uniref:3-isopropylmalate dehydratase small subunit n=1 Tax=Sphaerisporangium rubeum TaxID=321317 RepID=A0A7X0M807_9ACTN|nr:3-isopropylmalate dehydratase small subunit [Sphaerisporangium rubeum]MBB6474872.1 3-isopropylmalate/(R)-2-methylmalate dehydratase small subunit [Sphaerisporangium rubeum]
MSKFIVHTGTGVPLRRRDVDTDQIIPARFFTGVTRDGFAAGLFGDWRADPGFVLGLPCHKDATVLVAGDNFGSGSSREAAVWALYDSGFRVVIAPRFGDIFRANALVNGLLTVTASPRFVELLWSAIERDPATEITVDLRRLQITAPGLRVPFTLDPAVRERLLAGRDLIGMTLLHEPDIDAYERRRRPTPCTIRHRRRS